MVPLCQYFQPKTRLHRSLDVIRFPLAGGKTFNTIHMATSRQHSTRTYGGAYGRPHSAALPLYRLPIARRVSITAPIPHFENALLRSQHHMYTYRPTEEYVLAAGFTHPGNPPLKDAASRRLLEAGRKLQGILCTLSQTARRRSKATRKTLYGNQNCPC